MLGMYFDKMSENVIKSSCTFDFTNVYVYGLTACSQLSKG